MLVLAHYSGIGLRQAMALGVALMPMSSVALLLTLDTSLVPAFGSGLGLVLMSCIVILELAGPIVVQGALRGSRGNSGGKIMSLMPFASSRPLSVGVELELQLLSCNDYNLVSSAPDMLRRVAKFRIREK